MRVHVIVCRGSACGLLMLVLSGCSVGTPPVPSSAPAFEPFAAVVEYGRPAWSPDGMFVFFSGGPPEHYRVYRVPSAGGEPVDVLRRLHCGNPAVNYAARRMAYNSVRPKVALDIWTSELDGTAPVQLTKSGYNAFPEWSPDASQLSFLSFPDRTGRIIGVRDGAQRNLGPSLSPPVWRPNRNDIGLVEGRIDAGIYQFTVLSLTDGTRRSLKSSLQTNIPANVLERVGLRFDWSPDGKQVVLPVLGDGGRVRLALIDVEADRWLKMLPTQGTASDPRFSPDGRWIAYASEDTSHTRAIRVVARDDPEDRALTRPQEFVRAEFVQFPSADGVQIPSYLYRPASSDAVQKPAVVWLHGGGAIGAALDEFDPAIQYFVGNGFVVLQPNFRSSRGFGAELVKGVTGQQIATDVIAAAEYLKRVQGIDARRMAVFGASFGGYAVLRAITSSPGTFVAAVEVNGPSDLSALYQDRPMHRPVLTALLGGAPEQSVERYREESPILKANQITIPLLIIHGTADEVIPYQQSQRLAKSVQQAGNKACKLLTYSGVGHGFPGPLWANVMQNSLAFFKEHLNAP